MKPLFKYALYLLVLLNGFALLAQVGINTDNPQTILDVKGNLALRASALSLSNGTNNIVAGDNSFINITGPSSAFTINTIQPLTNVDGQVITLVNMENAAMTLIHDSGSGANSILCPSGSDLILKGIYTTVTLQYNKTLQRWLVTRYADGEVYQKNIRSSVATTNISTDLDTFSNMGAEMSVVLTTQTPLVFVNVSMAGNMDATANGEPAQGYGDFRLLKIVGGAPTVVAGFTTIATDIDKLSSVSAWNARLAMYPVSVTPGVATTLQVQWRRAGKNPSTLRCNPNLPARSHASITVLD